MSSDFQSRDTKVQVLGALLAVALGTTSAAFAQSATESPAAAQPPQPGQAPQDDDVLQQVTISSSRISRAGFEAPTPTTVVGAAEIQNEAAPRLSQVLFDLPELRPTATAVPFSASAGGTFANLRDLNPGSPTQTATRTLVLVDGMRIVPNTATGLVDLNAIPTSLVDRIDVVTGGASAAWGSDAVAGVVNFVLKKQLDGFEGSVQYGESQYSDTKDKSASLAWGTSYAGGRGQFMIAGEYDDLNDIGTVGTRPWGQSAYGLVSGTLNGTKYTNIIMPGTTTSGVTYGGVIVGANGAPLPATGPTSALRGIQFGPGGVAEPFTYGSYLSNNLMVGGSGANMSVLAALGAPVKRQDVYARTTFDFTKNIQGWAEFSYAQSDSVVDSQPMYLPNGDPVLTIQSDNAFLPSSIKSIMATNGLTSFGLGRILPEFGTYSLAASGTNVRRGAMGLDGSLAGGWTWKAYVGYGTTEYYDKDLNNINEPNLRAAVDTVIGPDGTAICRVNSTNPADIAIVSKPTYQGRGAAPGCVAADPFGPGSFSAAAVNYIMGTSAAIADFDQTTAGASIQGEPFSTWADKVSVAAGVDYRRQSIDQSADAIAQQTTPAFQTGSWQFANRRPLDGSYNVREYFGEVLVPLLKSDTPWIEALNLDAAVRATDYSTSGEVTSWKLGLTYKPVESVLLRGTYSRDIRAANLVELYTQGVSLVGGVTDYGRAGNPTVSVPTTTVGNPNLKPEIANTYTYGISWQPTGTGFHTSLDYYRIDLTDAIGSLGGQNIVNACYGVAPFTKPDPAACALIARDPTTNVITNITNSTLNLAYTNTHGEDLEVGYQLQMSQLYGAIPGVLDLRLLGTHLDDLNVNNGITTVNNAGQLGDSKWRGTLNLTWNNGPATVFLQGRYLSAATISNSYGPTYININHIPSAFYLNGTFSYDILTGEAGHRGKLQAFFGVNNILNRYPPVDPSASAGAGQTALAPDYDKIGRYFTAGLRFKY